MAEGVSPLSVGQQSLWLLYKLAPESSAYNDAQAALFRPAPDVAALGRAVTAVALRHDLLRSRFVEVDGMPGRVVEPKSLTPLEIRDVPEVDDGRLRALAVGVATEPFRLEDAGPLRVVLLRRREDAVLVVVTHHIATDALSQRLLWRDLTAAYRAYTVGREPELPALPMSYADYVAKEQALLDSPRRAAFEEHWLGVVGSGAVAAELPTDRPRPERSEFRGAAVRRTLPDELASGVHATATALGTTPFAVLVGAFQSLLHRYTGQAELLIGCPATTRHGAGLRDMVGLLVNTIVLRGSFQSGTTFADVSVAAGRQLIKGMTRVGYPFALLNSLRPGTGPLYRVAVTSVRPQLSDALPVLGDGPVEIAGHQVELLEVPTLEGQFDLTVEISQSTAGLAGSFRYDTALFDESTIDRFAGQFLAMLGTACADPTALVSRAPMTDQAQRRRLLELGRAL